MTWKELIQRKKLLSLSVAAVATLATVFLLYANKHTRTLPTSTDIGIPAIPTNTDVGDVLEASGTDVGDVLQASGSTGSGTSPSSFTSNQLAGNSNVDSSVATKADEEFNAILLANNDYPEYDYDFQASERGGGVGRGSDGTGSEALPEDFNAILLANNNYPEYDYDFQAIEGGVIESGRGASRESGGTVPDTSSGGAGEPPSQVPESGSISGNAGESPSAVPEPASMLLLGSGLIGLAVLGRKLKRI